MPLLYDSCKQTAWCSGMIPQPTRPRILDGVRIIDFTWVVAGPVATRILCDQGADVIKIERRDSLDFGTRRGGLTGNLNRGKESVVINMNDARGLQLARDLAATADVVIDNFSARVMSNWGLDYEGLRQRRPDIIAVNMSGFGRTGPHRDYVSYGPTLQALSGYTFSMRHPGKDPAGWGFSYSDMAAGYSGALAVLLALWHRRRTGRGQQIDLSQLENLVSLIGPPLLGLLADGLSPRIEGNRSPEAPAAPHGVYRCADLSPERVGSRRQRDRWCAISVFTDGDWQRFVRALGNPPWSRDPRFATLELRLQHHDDLDDLVGSWTRERPAEAVMEILQKAGVVAGLVADAEDLCDRDPQLRDRQYWATVETPEGDREEFDGPPFRLSERSGYVAAAGPLLGEHTDAVLSRVLRLSREAIAELRRAGVVA